MRAVPLLLALVLAAPVPATAAEDFASFERRMRQFIADYLEGTSLDARSVEQERLLSEARRRHQSGAYPPKEIQDWIEKELRAAFYSFGKPYAVHEMRARYGLPFDPRVPRMLSQGENGEQTHNDPENRHAFDFVMPIGTPVLAARAGVVGRVVDGFEKGGLDRSLRANSVYVVHPDGSFATYYHLSPGIPVKEGQQVKRGQELAKSGDTGYSQAPHLHFAVQRRLGEGQIESLPIRFGPPRSLGYVPQRGQFLGNPGQPNVELQLLVDGELTRPDTALPLARGASKRVGVRVVSDGGAVQDVTTDERTRFVVMTPWTVQAPQNGLVVAKPMQGFEDVPDPNSPIWAGATVAVYYEDPTAQKLGVSKVEFTLK